MVGLGGFEPPTSRLSGVRSNQLSYKPLSNRVTLDSIIYNIDHKEIQALQLLKNN